MALLAADFFVVQSPAVTDGRLRLLRPSSSLSLHGMLLQVCVSSTQEALTVMARGAANRAVADTKMNERSSRSHRCTNADWGTS